MNSRAGRKRGMLWSIAEIWSWLAMFVLILVFLFLFKFCSSPVIETTQGVGIAALDARHDAMAVLRTPVAYGGQDLTVAYLVALGESSPEFAKVGPVLLAALDSTMVKDDVGLLLEYAGRKERIVPEGMVPVRVLDVARLPAPSGTPITVTVVALADGRYEDSDTGVMGWA